MAIPAMRITFFPRPTHVALSSCLAVASLTVHAETSASARKRVDAVFAASLATSKAENAARAARLQEELKQQIAAFGAACGSSAAGTDELPALAKGIRNGVLLNVAPGHLPRQLGAYAVDFDRQTFVKVTQYLVERMDGPVPMFGDSASVKSCRLLRMPDGQTRLEVVAKLQVAPTDIAAVQQLITSMQNRREPPPMPGSPKSASWTGCSGARLSSVTVAPLASGKRLPEMCAEVGDKDLEKLFSTVAQPFRQALPK